MSKSTLTDIVTKNQVYLEKLKAQHVIDFDQVHGEIDTAISEVLGALEVESLDQLTKAQLSATLGSLRSTQGEVQLAALQDLTTKLEGTAGFQTAFEQTLLASVVKKGNSKIKLNNVAANTAFQHALDHPVADTGKLMESFTKSWSDSTLGKVEGAVLDGWAQGKTVPQVMQKIRGTKAALYKDGIMMTSRREAAAVVRTATQHVAQSARMATWAANGDLVQGYEILATLDGRTSAICRSQDGKKYDIGKGPVPPLHVNCRSTTIPTLGPEWDFLDEGATRSSLNGYVPADTTYYEWLKGQSPEFVADAIGPARASLLLDGKLSAKEFGDLNLGKNFEPMTLTQMAAKNPQVFKEAGLDKFIPDGAFEAAQQAAEEAAKKTAFANKMQEAKAAAAALKAQQEAAKVAAEKLAADQAALAAEKAAFAQKMQAAKAAAAAKKTQLAEITTLASTNKPLNQAHLDFLDTLTAKEKLAYKDAVEAQIAANKAAFAKKMQDAKKAAAAKKAAQPAATVAPSLDDKLKATKLQIGSKMWNGEVNLYNANGGVVKLFKSKADAIAFVDSEFTKLAGGGSPAPAVVKAAATKATTGGFTKKYNITSGKVDVLDPQGNVVYVALNSTKANDYIKQATAQANTIIATPSLPAHFDHNVKVTLAKVNPNSTYLSASVLDKWAQKPYADIKSQLSYGNMTQAEYDYIIAVKEQSKNKAGIAYGPLSAQTASAPAGYNTHSGYSSSGSYGAAVTHVHGKTTFKSVTKDDFNAGTQWPNHFASQAANSAVTRYTGSAYASINSQLRRGGSGSQSATIKDIKDWFASAPPVKDNLMVFRGVGLQGSKWDQVFKVGTKYSDKGFISSSAVKGSNFGGYQLRILVPKGSKGVAKVKHLSNYKSEDEVLFNSGEFEVVEADANGATLRYLGPAK